MNKIIKNSANILLGAALAFMTISQTATATAEIGLKNFAQIYLNLIESFGFEPVPAELKETYARLKSRLPQSGQVEDMNSAVPAAHLTLTHAACKFFVQEESAKPASQRRVFGAVDFAAPLANIKPDLIETVSTNIATLLFIEPLKTNQHKIVVEHMQKLVPLLTNSPNAPVLFMTEVCASVGASLGALVI